MVILLISILGIGCASAAVATWYFAIAWTYYFLGTLVATSLGLVAGIVFYENSRAPEN